MGYSLIGHDPEDWRQNMSDTKAKGEMHGCIVCGRLYQLYVAYDSTGKFIGSKVMSAGGKEVLGQGRPLVACERHTEQEIERAVNRVYGEQPDEDD
jgi:succinate dehydrogenase/fumarate reductase-like Fe-S protein